MTNDGEICDSCSTIALSYALISWKSPSSDGIDASYILRLPCTYSTIPYTERNLEDRIHNT